MADDLSTIIFDEPQGEVAGIVTLTATFKKSHKRIAHATLLANADAEISLSIPTSKMTASQLEVLTASMQRFAIAVREAEIKAGAAGQPGPAPR